MTRVILYVSVATIAFIVGVAISWSVNTLGAFAVDKVYRDATVDVKISTILPGPHSVSLPVPTCLQLIVCVTPQGALKLNDIPMGTLNDTVTLGTTLRIILEKRHAVHAYVDSLNLGLREPGRRQVQKTVYITAPRSMSYGELADLIAVIKAAGADPVELIASQPQL